MKRAALVLLVVPLIALWLYGCDQADNPLETQTTESTATGDTPLFAPGGKVKAEPNPIGCAQDDVAKWDATAGEWVCEIDETGESAGPSVYYGRFTWDAGNPVFAGSLPDGSSVEKGTELSEIWIRFASSVADCAITVTSSSDRLSLRAPSVARRSDTFVSIGNYHRNQPTNQLVAWQHLQEDLDLIMACP
jgi:hypothetical protein